MNPGMSRILGVPLLIGSALIIFSGCEFLRSLFGGKGVPSARLDRTEVSGVTWEHLQLNAYLRVDNPLGIALQIPAGNFTLKVEDQETGTISVPAFRVNASSTRTVVLPVQIPWNQIFHLLNRLYTSRKDSFRYEISGSVRMDGGEAFSLVVPVRISGTLPVLRALRIQVQSARITSISLSGATIQLDLQFQNPNRFSISLHNLTAHVQAGELSPVQSSLSPISLAGGQTQSTSLTVHLSFQEVIATARQWVQTGRIPVRATLEGNAELSSFGGKSFTLPLQWSSPLLEAR